MLIIRRTINKYIERNLFVKLDNYQASLTVYETQLLLYVPPGFTFINRTFCPQNALMFRMISTSKWNYFPAQNSQTASATVKCVYSAVRAESLNTYNSGEM